MRKTTFLIFLLISATSFFSLAQPVVPVYFNGAIKQNKTDLKKKIVQNSITKNLSMLLSPETEDYWTDAFAGMELLKYKSPWADGKIYSAFDSIEIRSTGFQRALLELVYANYPDIFNKQVSSLLHKTASAKTFAMCAEYLLRNNDISIATINFENKKLQLIKTEKDEAILNQLQLRLQKISPPVNSMLIKSFADAEFLNNNTVLFSFQRRNRNYPGIALIRDSTGRFVNDEDGKVFSVPQLARSLSNLPGYLTNGNTPQGIFRMHGFDTSTATFIGPTTNIQLTMPFETSLQHFLKDSTILDTNWTVDYYRKLLPDNLKNYIPLYESFYAGKAGRTEIIAHGTTVDPDYYTGELYYPQTPTLGCLCTKELWSEVDGKRLISDQQKLVTALQKAGGANGYCVVIEIDDAQKPVEPYEILSLLNNSK